MYCTYCGNEMPDDAVMCVKCGRLTPAYAESLKNGAKPCAAPVAPVQNEEQPAAEYDMPVQQETHIQAGGGKHISWIMSVLSIAAAIFVFLVFAFMHERTDDSIIFPVGAGILGIAGALIGTAFSVTSCVFAVREKRKEQRTSEYLFPSVLSLLLTLAAIIVAIIMMVFSVLYDFGYIY